MGKKLGMSAQLNGYLGQDVTYEQEQDGILLKVHDGVMELHYDSIEDEAKARNLATAYVNAYILRSGHKVAADFNHKWQKSKTGQTHHALNLEATVTVSERLQVQVTHQRTIQGKARIVTQKAYDSASFVNDEEMAAKAVVDETLCSALSYYANQVIDADQPMAGIYNAIEVVTNHLGGGSEGRKKLAALAGKSKTYVGDLMQSTQHARHPKTNANVNLPLEECKARAKLLIDAYAQSIKV